MRRGTRTLAALLPALAMGTARGAAAAEIVVTDAGDALHSQGCAATGTPPCTLRDAITWANVRPGKDTVSFSIGSGEVTIHLAGPLPLITDPVLIDGATQPGYARSPLIQIDGSGAGDEAVALHVKAGSSAIRGLAVGGFRTATLAAIVLSEKGGNLLQGNVVGGGRANQGIGILVRSGRNRIGGISPGAGNVISGNTGVGLRLQGEGNVVTGNRIGTDPEGTRARGNGGDGIAAAGGNTIGGAAPGEGNLVSGNGGVGISAGPEERILGNLVGTDVAGRAGIGNARGGIAGGGRIGGADGTRPEGPCSGACNLVSGNGGPGVAPAAGAVVQGNFIGTDAAGSAALPNSGAGVFVNGVSRVTIGGSTSASRNLISGNGGAGVEIAFDAEGVVVTGNLVGTDAAGVAPLGNADGVVLRDGARRNRIGGDPATEGNLIAFNRGPGVVLEMSASTGNAIRGNSIHRNGSPGIDLGREGVTPNHGQRPEEGPNAFQNFPVLTAATPYSVEGTLESTPEATFTIEVFSNSACDPSGHGPGETLIALTSVTTNAEGHAEFGASLTAPAGQPVTATAIDDSGNTSEFSPCVLTVQEPP